MHNKRILIYLVLGLIISSASISLIKILPESVWAMLQAVGAVIGVILVIIELRSNRDLSQGSFITNLSDSFNNNDAVQRIYKKLETNEIISDDDTVDIVAYLTYFETIYVLLKKNAIDISLIDDLFAYRFRLALRNASIQRISLVRYDSSYINLYKLDHLWCKYKKVKSDLEKSNPNNYPILVRGGKMKKEEIMLRKAQIEDAESIHNIMQRVYDLLDDKSIYVCDDLEYVVEHIEKKGLGVVAYNINKEIIASFILRFPKDSEDNLGRDINLPEEELDKVVHMETAVVLPEYRGSGLQKKMLDYAEKLIDVNKYNVFLATVSPKNPASFKTFEKAGYSHVLTKEKYGGLERRIYMKRVK